MNNTQPISDISPFDLTAINKGISSQVLGYYLTSTANIYVENTHVQPDPDLLSQHIDEIAQHLLESDNPQLVVSIHGYANKKSDAQTRYEEIYNYASKVCNCKTVFVGYRWPAENPLEDDPETGQKKANSLVDKIKFSFEAMPTLLLGALIANLVLGIVTISMLLGKPIIISNLSITFLVVILISAVLGELLNKLGNASGFIPRFPNRVVLVFFATVITAIATLISNPILSNFLLLLLTVVFVLGCGVVFALMALRLSTYPSDRYRANNYGVIDMVEFIRQLDKAIFKQACKQQIPEQEWANIKNINDEKLNKHRIKLSFINHSLGCEIVTQTVRILSDVFDPDAAKKPINNLVLKVPSPDIGRVFSLGRLVLVAPDIPVESILSGRANFLRSSLRRCEEAYVFSNEADLALRLASTAANYFSFPATTRFRGYKLGNITAKHYKNRDDRRGWKLNKKDYGIVNNFNSTDNKPYKHLELRASNLEHITLKELAYLKQPEDKQAEIERILEENAVADCFTYFDCTDYVDIKTAPGDSNIKNSSLPQKGLLSFALRKSALNFWCDYIFLAFAYFLPISKCNVHGGYFEGAFSQQLIYELAFLGFNEMLNKSFEKSLEKLSDCCQEKGIQVILGSKLHPKV